MPDTPLLKIKSLKKSFSPPTSAVNDVSLTVSAGEIVCLLGPSGCGKTTLLRIIAGLEAPDTGEVWFAGKNIASVPPHRRDFGMMFQDFALFPHKNVFDNVAFGLQMRGDTSAQIQARVAEMLALVDLIGYEQLDVSQLSGGEQQRVALARSLAPKPRLFLLDEPLGALDRALRERLMLDLRSILKQVGVTAIYVTHDQAEAFAIADRVAVMNAGKIEQIDSPQRIFAQPASPFVARFLGFQNLVEGIVEKNGVISTSLGQVQVTSPSSATGTTVTILIKPSAARPVDSSGQPATTEFEGTVTAISFRGKYYQVWIESAAGPLMFELQSVSNWQIGARIRLSLLATEMQVLPLP